MTILELLDVNFIDTTIIIKEIESDFIICAIYTNANNKTTIETLETDKINNILQRKIIQTEIENNNIIIYVNRRKDKKYTINERTL